MKIESFCLILELAVLPAQHPCFHINEANVVPASLDFSYNNAVLYLEVQFKAFKVHTLELQTLLCWLFFLMGGDGEPTVGSWGGRACVLPGPSHQDWEHCRKM